MTSSQQALDALFLMLPDVPGIKGRGVFQRAVLHADIKKYDLVCVQSFKPDYHRLVQQKLTVETLLPEKAGFALYAATRQREENRLNLARLWSLLPVGGILACTQANDLGARALEKYLRELAGDVHTFSKYHSRAMWAEKTVNEPVVLKDWLALANPQLVKGSSLCAAPGMFSWQAVDAGSALLAQHLPRDLAGYGADLGAGWGYLSHSALNTCSKVQRLDLYEAEKLSLDMARDNLAGFAGKAAFHWVDITREKPAGPYDFILCNPPFHGQQRQEISLGQKIVLQGLAALKMDGRMFMVANRHLPYEEVITQNGCKFNVTADAQGYKLLEVLRT